LTLFNSSSHSSLEASATLLVRFLKDLSLEKNSETEGMKAEQQKPKSERLFQTIWCFLVSQFDNSSENCKLLNFYLHSCHLQVRFGWGQFSIKYFEFMPTEEAVCLKTKKDLMGLLFAYICHYFHNQLLEISSYSKAHASAYLIRQCPLNLKSVTRESLSKFSHINFEWNLFCRSDWKSHLHLLIIVWYCQLIDLKLLKFPKLQNYQDQGLLNK